MNAAILIPLLTSLWGVSPPVTAAAFTPDGRAVLVGSQLGIETFDWPELQRQGSLPTRLPHVHDLVFSPDARRLAAAGGSPAQSGEIELFHWPSGQSHAHATLDDELIYKVAWSADGKQLAAAGGGQQVSLVRADGQVERELAGHSRGVLAVVYLGGDGHLVSAGLDHSLRVWNLGRGELQRTLSNHTAAVNDLAVRPGDAERMSVASAGADRTVRIWWPVVGRLVRFAQLPSEPLDLDWTPDGRRILAACRDGHLRVIDPETVEVLSDQQALDGWAYSVAAAPDGEQALVAGAGGQLRCVPLGTGAE